MKRTVKIVLLVVVAIVLVGYLIPERKAMPVGSPGDYNHQSFWWWPWGDHPHGGVDIFAKAGTPVVSQTGGIVVWSGYVGSRQGNSVYVLGPKWRVHGYYHLKSTDAKVLSFVTPDTQIGTVGNTGNAANTPSHVHYELATLIPYVWRYWDKTGVGTPPSRFKWLKMFYLNPADHIPTK